MPLITASKEQLQAIVAALADPNKQAKAEQLLTWYVKSVLLDMHAWFTDQIKALEVVPVDETYFQEQSRNNRLESINLDKDKFEEEEALQHQYALAIRLQTLLFSRDELQELTGSLSNYANNSYPITQLIRAAQRARKELIAENNNPEHAMANREEEVSAVEKVGLDEGNVDNKRTDFNQTYNALRSQLTEEQIAQLEKEPTVAAKPPRNRARTTTVVSASSVSINGFPSPARPSSTQNTPHTPRLTEWKLQHTSLSNRARFFNDHQTKSLASKALKSMETDASASVLESIINVACIALNAVTQFLIFSFTLRLTAQLPYQQYGQQKEEGAHHINWLK